MTREQRPTDDVDLVEAVIRFLDRVSDEEEILGLERRLLDDLAARRIFVETAALHGKLAEVGGAAARVAEGSGTTGATDPVAADAGGDALPVAAVTDDPDVVEPAAPRPASDRRPRTARRARPVVARPAASAAPTAWIAAIAAAVLLAVFIGILRGSGTSTPAPSGEGVAGRPADRVIEGGGETVADHLGGGDSPTPETPVDRPAPTPEPTHDPNDAPTTAPTPEHRPDDAPEAPPTPSPEDEPARPPVETQPTERPTPPAPEPTPPVSVGRAIATVLRVGGGASTRGRQPGVAGPVEATAAAGAELFAGAEVTVPGGASLMLAYADGTRMRLGPGTRATLVGDGPKHVQLEVGLLSCVVAAQPRGRPMTITTPLAQVEVVGTRFRLGSEATRSWLEVTEGKVRFGREGGKAAAVAAGQAAELDARGKLRARALGPAVVSFTLMDATTDAPIPAFDPLEDGDLIVLSELGVPRNEITIRANTFPREIGGVRFAVNGKPKKRDERDWPYILSGDDKPTGNIKPWSGMSPGAWTVSATPFGTRIGENDPEGAPRAVTFTIER